MENPDPWRSRDKPDTQEKPETRLRRVCKSREANLKFRALTEPNEVDSKRHKTSASTNIQDANWANLHNWHLNLRSWKGRWACRQRLSSLLEAAIFSSKRQYLRCMQYFSCEMRATFWLQECVNLVFQLNLAVGQALKLYVLGTTTGRGKDICFEAWIIEHFPKAVTDESLTGRRLMVEINLTSNGSIVRNTWLRRKIFLVAE